VKVFSVDPYQIGDENPEAVDSGLKTLSMSKSFIRLKRMIQAGSRRTGTVDLRNDVRNGEWFRLSEADVAAFTS